MADVDLMIELGCLGDLGAPGPPYYDVDAEKKMAGRVRAEPNRQQKNPLRPTRCARRWLAARSWTRLRRQERSARTTPASTATRAAPSGPRTQWNGDGFPHAWGRKRSRMLRAYSSERRIRARRSPLKPTSATCAVVSTRWSSSRRHRRRSRSVRRPTTANSEHRDPASHDDQAAIQRRLTARCLLVTTLSLLRLTAPHPPMLCSLMQRGPAFGRTSSSDSRPPTPLSPPTRRSPLWAPDVPVRTGARAPSKDGA